MHFSFHSYHGAGGEIVLWQSVKALTKLNENKENPNFHNIQILIYSNSKMKPEEILEKKVKDRFGIEISQVGLYFI